MAHRVFANRASSTLQSALTSGGIAITVAAGDGAKFPTIVALSGATFRAVIQVGDQDTDAREYVEVTARTGDTMTITRAQEGSTAVAFPAGATIAAVGTAATFNEFVQASRGIMTGPLNLAPTVSVAAAATVDLSLALSNTVTITGNSGPITSLGTIAAGAIRTLIFTGTPGILHNAVSLILPAGQLITVEAGDVWEVVSLGGGNWRTLSYTRYANSPETQAIGTLASASTIQAGSIGNKTINVTGTTTISSLGNGGSPGTVRALRFSTALQLTHSAGLKMPGAVDYQTQSGDTLVFLCISTGVWECIYAMRGDGQPIAMRMTGFVNILDNASMDINQQGLTNVAVGYLIDRWSFGTVGGRATASTFSTGSAPSGPSGIFQNAIRLSTTSAGALAAGDFASLVQSIEGGRIRKLSFGTANSQFMTLSFWVRTSVFGTYSVALRNVAATRSYVATFTTSTIGWEFKTLTIPVDAAGTWSGLNTSSACISVFFTASVGSTYAATPGSWVNGNFIGATGQTNMTTTASANFDITGVQLQEGIYATPFEFVPYDLLLVQAKRYRELVAGTVTTQQGIYVHNYFTVEKRAPPTVTLLTGGFAGSDLEAATTRSFRCPFTVLPSTATDFTVLVAADL